MLRESEHLSQRGLASASGLTCATIAHIETGLNSNPTIAVLRKLADYFDLTLDVLCDRHPTKYAGEKDVAKRLTALCELQARICAKELFALAEACVRHSTPRK